MKIREVEPRQRTKTKMGNLKSSNCWNWQAWSGCSSMQFCDSREQFFVCNLILIYNSLNLDRIDLTSVTSQYMKVTIEDYRGVAMEIQSFLVVWLWKRPEHWKMEKTTNRQTTNTGFDNWVTFELCQWQVEICDAIIWTSVCDHQLGVWRLAISGSMPLQQVVALWLTDCEIDLT